MADSPGVLIVEIRAGNSQRPVLELRPGEPVQPMSIGRVGMWSIDAPGVLDVHAYAYFDGRTLFIQSADPSNPAKGNGQAIATTWQQIEMPCTIEVGRARLVYRSLDEMDDGDEDKTVAQAINIPKEPPQFRPGAGTFSNRNNGPDSDATRLAPSPAMSSREPDPTVVSPLEMGTPAAGVPKARPAAGMPAWSTDAAPHSSPTNVAGPPAPPPPQNTGYQAFGSVQVAVPQVPAAPNNMQSTLQAPMQSPLAQQQQQQQPLMMPSYTSGPNMGPPMMGPPMMGPPNMGPPNMMMGPNNSQPMMMGPGGSGPMPGMDPGTARVATGELKGLPKAIAEWNAMPPLRKIILGTFPGVAILAYFMLFDDEPQQQARARPHPSASVSASANISPSASALAMTSATSGSTAVATNTAPITTVVPTASTVAIPISSAPPPPKGKRTLERDAIDLVSLGQNAKAAELYDQLAQQHPDQPAFREAARILRARGNNSN